MSSIKQRDGGQIKVEPVISTVKIPSYHQQNNGNHSKQRTLHHRRNYTQITPGWQLDEN